MADPFTTIYVATAICAAVGAYSNVELCNYDIVQRRIQEGESLADIPRRHKTPLTMAAMYIKKRRQRK